MSRTTDVKMVRDDLHGRGDEDGPHDEGCDCTGHEEDQADCAEAGCGFCRAGQDNDEHLAPEGSA